jgi:hypothetical protein
MSHPVEYILMVKALNGTAHANAAFWPLEASIILYGLGGISHMTGACGHVRGSALPLSSLNRGQFSFNT